MLTLMMLMVAVQGMKPLGCVIFTVILLTGVTEGPLESALMLLYSALCRTYTKRRMRGEERMKMKSKG